MSSAGRVLLVGRKAGGLAGALTAKGYRCDAAPSLGELDGVVARSVPDAVVVSMSARLAGAAVKAVRRHPLLKSLPVLLEGSAANQRTLSALDVDGVATDLGELERQLAASLRARRASAREDLVRQRLQLLLEIARAASAGHPGEALFQDVAGHLNTALGSEGASLLVLEGEAPRRAYLIDARGRAAVDLAVTPMMRRALESREVIASEGTWIQPLPSEDVAAIVLRRAAPLSQEEQDFLTAVGGALSHALERDQARASQERSRESIELAYLDRYRELQEANARLKALDRKKNEMLGVLSHDLRAPLNVLLGHAHLLVTDQRLSTDQQASVAAMQRTGRKILDLVERLLDQARGDGGPIVLFSRTMDAAEAVQEAVRDLQILAREKGVALRAEAPMSLPVVGDEQKIRQVLQNLINNALTHAKGAKTVVVRALLRKRPDGDAAYLEVRDDGAVADPNDVLLAFERSRGLGLSICRDYVERHGGEIWAEAPPGGGGVFCLTLPLKRDAAALGPAAVRGDARVPLVLLAEDDPVFTRVCTIGLSGHYRVEVARDGDEAVAMAKRLLPDVIAMDVFMPNRDGLDALRELKATPETAAIPVLLISGHLDLPEKLGALDLGPVDFLAKPFSLSTLVTRVGEALQRAPRPSLAAPPGIDSATGLFDQVGLGTRLEQELARCRRFQRPVTLAVLRPGAKVPAPAPFAALLRRELHAPDVGAHLGDGVLCVLFPETTTAKAGPTLDRLVSLLTAEGGAWTSRAFDVHELTAEAALERLLTQ